MKEQDEVSIREKPMKVRDLIDWLSKVNEDAEVLVYSNDPHPRSRPLNPATDIDFDKGNMAIVFDF